MSQCVLREADGGVKKNKNTNANAEETYFRVPPSHNCSLQVNLNRIRGVIGKTQCWFNAPRAGVRAWRLRGTCQRMTLTGCDDTQFVLLCLNCHLMCLQSGAVDTLVGRDLREPLKSGLTTSRTEPMTPTVSWMWPNWARKHVLLALACLSLSPVILVS